MPPKEKPTVKKAKPKVSKPTVNELVGSVLAGTADAKTQALVNEATAYCSGEEFVAGRLKDFVYGALYGAARGL